MPTTRNAARRPPRLPADGRDSRCEQNITSRTETMIEQLSYTRTQGKTLDTSNVLGALERVTRRLSGGLHPARSAPPRSSRGSVGSQSRRWESHSSNRRRAPRGPHVPPTSSPPRPLRRRRSRCIAARGPRKIPVWRRRASGVPSSHPSLGLSVFERQRAMRALRVASTCQTVISVTVSQIYGTIGMRASAY